MELRHDLPRRRALRLFLPAAAAAPLAMASCAAPPKPPQSAASPAPAAPVGNRAYIVFFPLNSAEIGDRARQIIAEAAKNLGTVERGTARIELDAYTDRSGSTGHNRRLSRRRAEAVAAELRRQGVRPERIAVRVHGEGRSFVPTRDGEQEAQNRGVWITHR